MYKLILKIFDFFKNALQFFKIVTMFTILMLILYWINNLAEYNWHWLDFIKPMLDSFLSAGNVVASGDVKLFNATFEFKYGVAALMLLAIFYFFNFLIISITKLEDILDDGRRMVNKIEEKAMNLSFKAAHTIEQNSIKKYRVFINAELDKKFSSSLYKVNVDEQIEEMHKFINSKLGVTPQLYREGFIYNFSDFSNIDKVLDVFYKIANSKNQLSYVICLQIEENDFSKTEKELQALINLNLKNKIAILANVAYRYKFNKFHGYSTPYIGVYQNGDKTFDVHEFQKIAI